jgi:hypothetical protein
MPEILRTTGQRETVQPANGRIFTLRELQAIVGGTIAIQRLPRTGGFMVLHDEGKLLELPINEAASTLWCQNYPLDEYPVNNDGLIAGDVLICQLSDLESPYVPHA